MGVTKSASEDDIKKQYKKLAIKVHPDKNRAPQAEAAFKKVSVAYACLTDKEKRKIYDLTGEEPGQNHPSQRRSNGRAGFRHSEFEQEIDPQEIFEMFFGGGMYGHHHRRRSNH